MGSGAYGVVASAVNRQNNKKVAIKKVTSISCRLLMLLMIWSMLRELFEKSNFSVITPSCRILQAWQHSWTCWSTQAWSSNRLYGHLYYHGAHGDRPASGYLFPARPVRRPYPILYLPAAERSAVYALCQCDPSWYQA